MNEVKSKRIRGNTYFLKHECHNRNDALNKAEKIKENGNLAQVISEKFRFKKIYSVWATDKV